MVGKELNRFETMECLLKGGIVLEISANSRLIIKWERHLGVHYLGTGIQTSLDFPNRKYFSHDQPYTIGYYYQAKENQKESDRDKNNLKE